MAYGPPGSPVPHDPMSQIVSIDFPMKADIGIMITGRAVGGGWGTVYYPEYPMPQGKTSYGVGRYNAGTGMTKPIPLPNGDRGLYYGWPHEQGFQCTVFSPELSAFPNRLPTPQEWERVYLWHVGHNNYQLSKSCCLVNFAQMRKDFDTENSKLKEFRVKASLSIIGGGGGSSGNLYTEVKFYRDIEKIGISGIQLDTESIPHFESGKLLATDKKDHIFNLFRAAYIRYDLKKKLQMQVGTG